MIDCKIIKVLMIMFLSLSRNLSATALKGLIAAVKAERALALLHINGHLSRVPKTLPLTRHVNRPTS